MNDGRRWARFWLIVALIVSVVANVTHTVLADSGISLWLRIPGAVVWPVFTFAGIEILVRMIWERRWTHTFTQAILLAAAVPAAITSYEHQYTLLGMMGERQLIQIIGPAAIDGLMVGCTMALLFTRATAVPATQTSVTATSPPRQKKNINAIVAKWSKQLTKTPAYVPTAEELEQAEQMSRDLDKDEPARAQPPRRVANEDLAVRVMDLMERGPRFELADNSAPGASTLRKYAKVARLLWTDAYAPVDYRAERVNEMIVESIIRPAMKRERIR